MCVECVNNMGCRENSNNPHKYCNIPERTCVECRADQREALDLPHFCITFCKFEIIYTDCGEMGEDYTCNDFICVQVEGTFLTSMNCYHALHISLGL